MRVVVSPVLDGGSGLKPPCWRRGRLVYAVSPVLDGGSGLKLAKKRRAAEGSWVSPVLDGGSGLKHSLRAHLRGLRAAPRFLPS